MFYQSGIDTTSTLQRIRKIPTNYPLIINHGVLENPPFRSMIFAFKNINICMVDLRSLCSIEHPPFIVDVLSYKPPICIYIYSENSTARIDCQRVNTSKSLCLSHYHPYRFPLNPIRSLFVDGETSISQPWQYFKEGNRFKRMCQYLENHSS